MYVGGGCGDGFQTVRLGSNGDDLGAETAMETEKKTKVLKKVERMGFDDGREL